MRVVNMHAAKTNLSRLVEAARGGEEIVIARAGKPMAKLVAAEPSAEDRPRPRRLGLLADKLAVPEDFDSMFAEEIRDMFEGR